MKKLLIGFVIAVFGLTSVAMPVFADDETVVETETSSESEDESGSVTFSQGKICDQITDAELRAAAGCEATTSTATTVISNILTVLISLVAVGAVIVIVYAGYMYTTSAGDPGKATRARNAILYGVIGIIVAMLAYAIVYFVSSVLS